MCSVTVEEEALISLVSFPSSRLFSLLRPYVMRVMMCPRRLNRLLFFRTHADTDWHLLCYAPNSIFIYSADGRTNSRTGERRERDAVTSEMRHGRVEQTSRLSAMAVTVVFGIEASPSLLLLLSCFSRTVHQVVVLW